MEEYITVGQQLLVNTFLADQKKCVYGEEKGMIAWDVSR